MPNYLELLIPIDDAYKNESNGFHTPDSASKIFGAFDGLALPFQRLGNLIDRQLGRHFTRPEEYKFASRNLLRVIDQQLNALIAATNNAARADRLKVQQIVVDRGVAAKKAEIQQSADRELVNQIRHLIAQVKSDVQEAGNVHPGGGGSVSGTVPPIDLAAFRKSLKERAAPKEDKIVDELRAQISGQASPLISSRN